MFFLTFLWGTLPKNKKFRLVYWNLLACPTSMGGWGIKHLTWFNLSLRLKSFWLALNGNGIWYQLLSVKYMKKLPLHSWLREKCFSLRSASVIWRGFLLTISWLGKGLIWQVGNGSSIRLGVDPIVGLGSSFLLPHDLRDYLEDYGICTLDHARNQTPFAKSYWFSVDDLDLQGDWKIIWENFTRGLEFGRIRLSEHYDSLLWSHNKYVGPLTTAMGYDCITSSCCSEDQAMFLIWSGLSIYLWKLDASLGYWAGVGYWPGINFKSEVSRALVDVFFAVRA